MFSRYISVKTRNIKAAAKKINEQRHDITTFPHISIVVISTPFI